MTNQKLARDVEQFLASGGQIQQVPGMQWRPYLESTRKQDPEIAARHAQKARERAKMTFVRGSGMPDGYLSFSAVIARLRYARTGASQQHVLKKIEAGEFPPPEYESISRSGNIARGWKPETIAAYEEQQKILR